MHNVINNTATPSLNTEIVLHSLVLHTYSELMFSNNKYLARYSCIRIRIHTDVKCEIRIQRKRISAGSVTSLPRHHHTHPVIHCC